MTRQRKTTKQRAEETLAVARRKRDRLLKDATVRRADLAAVESELAEAERRLDYATHDPALQSSTTTSSTHQAGDTA